MRKAIVRDVFFLRQKSEEATRKDLPLAADLQDTLTANADRCVGMAGNMIGIRKRIIIVTTERGNVVMFNPVLLRKDGPYETEEGCLSLDGVRKTVRYRDIEIEYRDTRWNKRRGEILRLDSPDHPARDGSSGGHPYLTPVCPSTGIVCRSDKRGDQYVSGCERRPAVL